MNAFKLLCFTNRGVTPNITALSTALEYNTSQGIRGYVARLNDTRVVVANFQSATVQNVQTFELNRTTGAVTANGSPLTFYAGDGLAASTISIVVFDESHFGIWWVGADSDGFARTFQVDEDGAITAWGAQIEFDATNGSFNSAVLMDETHILNVWRGTDDDGFAAIFTLEEDGDLVMGTPFEFDTNFYSAGSVTKISPTKVAVVYTGLDSDGSAIILDINTSTWTVSAAGSIFEWIDATTVNTNSVEIMTTSPLTLVNGYGNSSNTGLRQLSVNTSTWAITNLGTSITGVSTANQNNNKRVVLRLNNGYFLWLYTDSSTDGIMEVRSFDSSDGSISSALASLEFDTDNAISISACDMGQGLIVAIWAGTGNDGFIQAFRVSPSTSLSPVESIEVSPLDVVRQSVNFDVDEIKNGTLSSYNSKIFSGGVEVDEVFTKSGTFNLSSLGLYDLQVRVGRSNTLDRYYPNYINVLPVIFEEGDADVVLDLDAVTAGTFSNPLGDASIGGNGTEQFTYNFASVSRPGLKIYLKGSYSGRIIFVGLRGTSGNPVIIQSPTSGQATIEAGHSTQSMAWHFNANNQYIRIDGRASSTHKYGIKITGDGGARRGILFQGDNQRGIEMYGVEIDMGRAPSDTSEGGSGWQWSPPTPDSGQNALNWSAEYIILMHNYIHNNWGEGVYIGYFSDALQSGYRPDRMGNVIIGYNIFDHSSRDPIQIGASDYGAVFNNVISNTGEELAVSHRAAIVWNDGNLDTYTYNNYITDVDLFISSQSGDTGTGTGYIYSNFVKQRETILTTTPNNFSVLSVESLDYEYQFFNNTIICPDVADAPVGIYRASGGETLDFTFAGNVISTGGTDQATYDELAIIGSHTTSGWLVSNIWERTADEADLLLDSSYRPSDDSPAFGSGFDWQTRFPGIFIEQVRNRDIDGYMLKSGINKDGTLTSGAYSGSIDVLL